VRWATNPIAVPPAVLGGSETLEVVGESHYQDHLWHVAGGFRHERVRCAVQAVLDPEPKNPHDVHAVRVLVSGGVGGYLSREDAAAYLPGLQELIRQRASPIALDGHLVGGGRRPGGIGMLGIFLDHDPSDFGVRTHQVMHIGELRTGLSQAIATDLEDDRYDLSWYDQLSGTHDPGDVVVLRKLLKSEADPIDRHFMLSELSKTLYKSRDAFASALDEFDAACLQHDAEMDVIGPALVAKFGRMPIVDMYRQAAIRCQKARDWHGTQRWAERGLAVYGPNAGRPEAVADLQKRVAHAQARRTAGAAAPRRSTAPRAATSTSNTNAAVETLICSTCGLTFQRTRARGRKPHQCPACRAT